LIEVIFQEPTRQLSKPAVALGLATASGDDEWEATEDEEPHAVTPKVRQAAASSRGLHN
jgi:hypothetical protein